MKGLFLTACIALPLAACAANTKSGYMDEKYTASGAKPYEMTAEDPFGQTGPWFAYDLPTEAKVMISPTYGAAMSMGARGAGIGHAESFIPHQPFYEGLAVRYFTETGKPTCRIVRGYKVSHAQYEFLYECGVSPAPARPVRKRPST